METITKTLIIFLTLFLFGGCTNPATPTHNKGKVSLPAITQKPTHQYYQGKFVWHDLVTSDTQKAKAFYGELFGWKFQDKEGYTMVYNHQKPIAGIIEVSQKNREKGSVWLPWISVKSVDKAVASVMKHNAKIIKGPLVMEQRGKGVLLEDPYGAQFVLVRTVSGDPLDNRPEVGDWLWNELWTNEAQKSETFYQGIGGYRVSSNKNGYRIFMVQDKWRAGIREIKKQEITQHWVPVVRVESLTKTLSSVDKAGGKVLLSPRKSLMNGNVALIMDSVGTHLIVQHWDEES